MSPTIEQARRSVRGWPDLAQEKRLAAGRADYMNQEAERASAKVAPWFRMLAWAYAELADEGV